MFYKRLLATALPAKGQYDYLKNLKRLYGSLSATIDDRFIVINDKTNSKSMKFPDVWLRDNCQCSECFHKPTNSRILSGYHSNIGVRVNQMNTIDMPNSIKINWSDNHQSIFDLNWLKERDFGAENRTRYREDIYKPPPQLWSKNDYLNVLKDYQFKDIISNDNLLLDWLEALAVYGFALLRNAPNDVNVVRQLADRIGFIKRTTYGDVFEVKSKENAKNYAYMMVPLPLHTDMPYYEYKAGINILHCYVQSKSNGGANLITDGFYIAEQMRKNYHDFYNILLNTPVDWYDYGSDGGLSFYNIWRSPVFNLDIDGQYQRINHNINKRDSHFTIEVEKVIPWYEAYDKFLQMANNETVEFKTKPGDVFVFNNLRLLHGRTAYEDSSLNKRHLIGAYVDWDIIYSKMRILKTQNELK